MNTLAHHQPLKDCIVIVGTSGAGKTTLARELANRLDCPHVELDALHWERNWTNAPLDVFRTRVQTALDDERWVVDGNYSSKAQDLILEKAKTVIWLDYPLPIILWRLTKRTFRRILTREELWNGNRESLRLQFRSSDSIFVWAIRTHRRRRRQFTELFEQPEHAHLNVIRFESPQAAARWLADIC